MRHHILGLMPLGPPAPDPNGGDDLYLQEFADSDAVNPSSRIGPFSRVRPVENQQVNEKGLHYSGGLELARNLFHLGHHLNKAVKTHSGDRDHRFLPGTRRSAPV